MKVTEVWLRDPTEFYDIGGHMRTTSRRVSPGPWEVAVHWNHRVLFCSCGERQVMIPFESVAVLGFEGEHPKPAGRPAKGDKP